MLIQINYESAPDKCKVKIHDVLQFSNPNYPRAFLKPNIIKLNKIITFKEDVFIIGNLKILYIIVLITLLTMQT